MYERGVQVQIQGHHVWWNINNITFVVVDISLQVKHIVKLIPSTTMFEIIYISSHGLVWKLHFTSEDSVWLPWQCVKMTRRVKDAYLFHPGNTSNWGEGRENLGNIIFVSVEWEKIELVATSVCCICDLAWSTLGAPLGASLGAPLGALSSPSDLSQLDPVACIWRIYYPVCQLIELIKLCRS